MTERQLILGLMGALVALMVVFAVALAFSGGNFDSNVPCRLGEPGFKTVDGPLWFDRCVREQ